MLHDHLICIHLISSTNPPSRCLLASAMADIAARHRRSAAHRAAAICTRRRVRRAPRRRPPITCSIWCSFTTGSSGNSLSYASYAFHYVLLTFCRFCSGLWSSSLRWRCCAPARCGASAASSAAGAPHGRTRSPATRPARAMHRRSTAGAVRFTMRRRRTRR